MFLLQFALKTYGASCLGTHIKINKFLRVEWLTDVLNSEGIGNFQKRQLRNYLKLHVNFTEFTKLLRHFGEINIFV